MVYEGAPTGMRDVAQTPDGWLWIAGAEGLFRFDGSTFEMIPVPDNSPMARASAGALLVTRSGELLIGYNQYGGIASYSGGRFKVVPLPARLAVITDLKQAPDGAIWAVSGGFNYKDHRLYRYKSGRWEDIDRSRGLNGGFVSDLCFTRDGTAWVALSDEQRGPVLVNLPSNSARFRVSKIAGSSIGCMEARDGRLWVRTGGQVGTVSSPDDPSVVVKRTSSGFADTISTLQTSDDRGGVWGQSKSGGVFYWTAGTASKADRVVTYSQANGLSSDRTYSTFIDRDGNVWITGEFGLDRFRRAAAVQDRLLYGQATGGMGIVETRGSVFALADGGLYELARGGSRNIDKREFAGQCSSPDGGFWVIDDGRLLRIGGSRKAAIPFPASLKIVGACANDGHGRIWAVSESAELSWFDGRRWHGPSKLLPRVHNFLLAVMANGDLAYTTETDLVRVGRGGVSIMPLKQYDPGLITSLSAEGRDLFISGNNGLLRIRGGEVARLDWRRAPWAARLRDLVQTSAGDTWMMRASFTSRVATADLQRAFEDPAAPLPRTILDLRDGLGPPQSNTLVGPQMAFGSDGTLWQLNRFGATKIDPRLVASDSPSPPVVIRQLKSGTILLRDPVRTALPPGTTALELAYTALSYAHPERVRFRYRLEGVDRDWVEAGSRRFATYSNLGPGHYSFEVVASDDERRWTSPPARLEISIRPTFLQSSLFKLLCGLLLISLLWVLYSMRLRTVASRIRMRMIERGDERERIARELHDTLLQSVQGLSLRFQSIVSGLPEGDPRRSELEEALDRADDVIAEGRNRVQDLRSRRHDETVEEGISQILKRQGFGSRTTIRLTTSGAPRPLTPMVHEEVLRISGEAIANIWRHARASRVTVELGYRTQFQLSIHDNGIGMPMEHTANGQAGRFGVRGMRERAMKLRGTLEFGGGTSGGTRIMLSVPGKFAYADHVPWFARWLNKRRWL